MPGQQTGDTDMDVRKIAQTILLITFVVLIFIAGCNMLSSFNAKKQESGVINTSGRIEGDEYNAGSKIAGKVDRLLVDEGDPVKKGDLLGNIYSEQLKASLDSAQKDIQVWQNKIMQAETALQQAQAQTNASVNQAEANLNVNTSQYNKARANHALSIAELDRARLQVSQSKLDYDQAQASLKKAQANLTYNEKEYMRSKNLLKEDAIARTRYEAVEAQYIAAREDCVVARKQVDKALKGIEDSRRALNVAEANVNMAEAGIREGSSVVDAGHANVNLAKVGVYDVESRQKDVNNAQQMLEKAKAAFKSAQADVEDSKVYSPIDGVVMNKIVEPGEVISGGTPLVTIVNMDSLYLRVYVPTSIQGKLRLGNPAVILPDSFDGKEGREKREFEGYVYKISEKAEFTPKNVETKEQRAKLVFSVKIKIKNNKDHLLKPGMPCEATIDTSTTEPVEKK